MSARETAVTLKPPLVLIEGGEFVMGRDDRRDDERPAHRVRIGPFRAAVAPVTNAEYARFAAATGASAPPFLGDPRFSDPDQPAVGIGWFEALAFCDWLSNVTGVRFRLPTEAEREFASRGGLTGGDWPWATAHPVEDWIASLDQPHIPRPACANGYGLRCLAENVHEWCSDWYAPTWYASSPCDAPSGPADGKRRVARGGAWRHSVKFTRVTARSSLDPKFHYNDFGFRVYASA